MVERVIAAGLDGVEYGKTAAAEHFEIDAEAGVDHFCERHALGEQRARASDQILHQVNVTVVEAALYEVGFGKAVRRGDIERNVNAALFEVARDVLPEIGELQCSAGGVGELLALLITIAAEIENEAADWACRIDAIIQDRVPSGIPLDRLILAKGFEQVGEGLLGNFFGGDGLAQRDEDRMRRMPGIAGVQFLLPPIKKFEGALRVRNFVTEIVGPAAIGVDVVKMLVQLFREKPGNYIKVFVMVRGEPARVGLRNLGRAA